METQNKFRPNDILLDILILAIGLVAILCMNSLPEFMLSSSLVYEQY